MENEPGVDLERLRSIGHLKGGRTGSRSTSGREHPESGLPFKATTDELGNTVTEHSDPGSGVSVRQDVEIRPETVHAHLGPG
jgi:hypothetical protein